MDDFRAAAEMKYKLMPYIYSQAYLSSQAGHPLLRAMFLEFPDDPTCWMIEDQYFFGSDILVAPLFEETDNRIVYLPEGQWVDYQTGAVYKGQQWITIEAGQIPIIMLVRAGASIPHVELALTTDHIDWDQVSMIAYTADGNTEGKGKFYHPLREEWVEVN